MKKGLVSYAPIVAGAGLILGGLALKKWRPTALDMPKRRRRPVHFDRGAKRQMRRARDGMLEVAPDNLTNSLARTAMLTGAGVLIVRALDKGVDKRERQFR